jgi:intracellular multiplication protein IcmQ
LDLTPKEVKDRLLEAIDQAIEKGDWMGSLFLANILKQLQDLRAYVAHELDDKVLTAAESQKRRQDQPEREGYVCVYISLYQAESDRLDRWFSSIKMLASYGVSRPVYASEEEIQHMIRDKQSRSDAYVSIWVKKTDILPAVGLPSKDRWGYPLLSLREGSIRLENIIAFFHSNEEYYLTDQGLVLVE